MRSYWIASILTTLMSMGLLVVNTGQYQMLAILNTRNIKLQNHSEILYKKLLDEEIFKVTLENLVNRAKKVVTDLDAKLVTLNSEMEKKKTENDDCQAQQKKNNDELAGQEKIHTDTQGAFKSESDGWNQKRNTLKAQLTEKSPVCSYVKKSALPELRKLCEFNATILITSQTKQ